MDFSAFPFPPPMQVELLVGVRALISNGDSSPLLQLIKVDDENCTRHLQVSARQSLLDVQADR